MGCVGWWQKWTPLGFEHLFCDFILVPFGGVSLSSTAFCKRPRSLYSSLMLLTHRQQQPLLVLLPQPCPTKSSQLFVSWHLHHTVGSLPPPHRFDGMGTTTVASQDKMENRWWWWEYDLMDAMVFVLEQDYSPRYNPSWVSLITSGRDTIPLLPTHQVPSCPMPFL